MTIKKRFHVGPRSYTFSLIFPIYGEVGIGDGADNIYSLSPLRVIVHAAHAWKCTKDAQIRVDRSEDRKHKTLSVSLCWV